MPLVLHKCRIPLSLPFIAALLLLEPRAAVAQPTAAELQTLAKAEASLAKACDAVDKAREKIKAGEAGWVKAQRALDELLKAPKRDPADVKRLQRECDDARSAARNLEPLRQAELALKKALRANSDAVWQVAMNVAGRAANQRDFPMAAEEALKAALAAPRGSQQQLAALSLLDRCNGMIQAAALAALRQAARIDDTDGATEKPDKGEPKDDADGKVKEAFKRLQADLRNANKDLRRAVHDQDKKEIAGAKGDIRKLMREFENDVRDIRKRK